MAARRRIDWPAILIGLVTLGAVVVVFSLRDSETVRAVEEEVFDQYQRWQPRPYRIEDPEAPGTLLPPPPVRVIDIDEASLKELGQWPWPRFYLAEMVRRLTNAGAAAIAFDVVFAEPDRTSPERLAGSYARFGEGFGIDAEVAGRGVNDVIPDHDALFAAVIAQAPVVLGTIGTDNPQTDRLPRQPQGISVSGDGGDIRPVIPWFKGATPNLEILSQDAAGIGAIVLNRDESSVVRRVPLIVAIGENEWVYPSLAIEALRVAQGAHSHIVKTSRGSGEADFSDTVEIVDMKTGGAIVPLDGDGALRVRYSAAFEERVIPAHRVLAEGGLPPEIADQVAGHILFVGSSAETLFDIRTTPLHARISGVHIQAEIVEQIWHQDFLERPDWSLPLERLVMIVGGLVIVLFVGNTLPLLGFVALVGFTTAIGVGSWVAFSEYSLLLNPVAPALAVVAPHFVVSGYKYFTSEAHRREITRQFEHFVSPEVIEDIIEDPDRYLTPGGAERVLSILFLDVRRFSTITEKMKPQEVISFINDLLTPLTDVIIENEGTIDKYMGDAVMAFWNAPRETEDHEIKAVRAMLGFPAVLEKINPEFSKRGIPLIEIGAGVNTGECSVGNMGSLKRLAYSCVGDAVNLASRLEGQTKAYGVQNLIGSATAAAVREAFAIVELDAVAVKGRTQPETIYTVAGDATLARDPRFVELAGILGEARAAYLAQEWHRAEDLFAKASGFGAVGIFDPAFLAEVMTTRIGEYLENPPPADWDGVYVATSK